MPGAYEAMQTKACSQMRLCQLIPHAGHWVQQERPDEVNALLLGFLNSLA
jgi:pimeloyl-ACP methyl ester carboxylesterase